MNREEIYQRRLGLYHLLNDRLGRGDFDSYEFVYAVDVLTSLLGEFERLGPVPEEGGYDDTVPGVERV